MKLYSILFILSSALTIVFATGCSESEFTAAAGSKFQKCLDVRPEVQCVLSCDADGSNCSRKFDYTIDAASQTTDVLFVIDNSASMYDEQEEISNKFPSFFSGMQGIDFRVGVTATDMASAVGLGSGNLIPFANNQTYLSGQSSSGVEQGYFQDIIKRQETLNCKLDNYSGPRCPNGTERGLLSAAHVFELNSYNNFIRPSGHMAVVFLSDEDEGSDGSSVVDFRERPSQFVSDFRSKFPNKSIKAHSIIIDPNSPEGRACYNDAFQKRFHIPMGEYGRVYSELSLLTGGEVGDICANDYTSVLQKIAAESSQFREVLPCAPLNGKVDVTYAPALPSGFNVTHDYQSFQNEVLFSRTLPVGTKVNFKFECFDNGQ